MSRRGLCCKLECEALTRIWRGATMVELGELDRGIDEVRRAFERADRKGLLLYRTIAQLGLAGHLIARAGSGDAEEADALLDAAEARTRETGARPLLARALIARAGLCELRGDDAGRDRHREQAATMARQMNATGLLAELEAERTATE